MLENVKSYYLQCNGEIGAHKFTVIYVYEKVNADFHWLYNSGKLTTESYDDLYNYETYRKFYLWLVHLLYLYLKFQL